MARLTVMDSDPGQGLHQEGLLGGREAGVFEEQLGSRFVHVHGLQLAGVDLLQFDGRRVPDQLLHGVGSLGHLGGGAGAFGEGLEGRRNRQVSGDAGPTDFLQTLLDGGEAGVGVDSELVGKFTLDGIEADHCLEDTLFLVAGSAEDRMADPLEESAETGGNTLNGSVPGWSPTP